MMVKKNLVKGITAVCAALFLVMNLLFPTVVSAKNDNKKNGNNGNTGVGQIQVHIHNVSGITVNKGSVTITMEDSATYSGILTGSTLTIEMGTTDNGFDIEKGESLTVPYATGDGKTGMLTVTHKEGNGNKIQNEYDQGLNNFNGTYTVDGVAQQSNLLQETVPQETVPQETVPQETVPQETIPQETIPQETIPQETIPQETIPQETIPQETVIEEIIEEEEVPLVEKPEVEIEEEDTPLADLPKTGDPFVVMFAVMAAVSGGGVTTLLFKKKD